MLMSIGLPDSARALAAQTAIRAGDEGATKENGPWLLTLDMPSYLPAMQHLKNRDIREKLYRAYVTRASTGATDNAPIIQRILQIKTETSRLLGYNCYAEQSLAKKMAPSIDAVGAIALVIVDFGSSSSSVVSGARANRYAT
jgi:oligopeptidase A